MSNEDLIGVDPLDWMNKSEVENVKKEISSEKNTFSLVLEKNFDIRNLDTIYKNISDNFQDLKNIDVDISNVSKLDAASIQFLVSLKKTADDKLINIQFQNQNDYFKKSIDLMGLTAIFS